MPLHKADIQLRDAIAKATEQEELRIVLTIQQQQQNSVPPTPTQFSTREEYRRVLIDYHKARLAEMNGEIIRSIEEMGLKIIAGRDVFRTIVAIGTAPQIISILALQGIERAILDHSIEMRTNFV